MDDSVLVLLHGFGGRPESFEPVRAQLEPGVSVLALPLPGHHPSAPLEAGARFEAVTSALAARLPDRCELLGYSLGARIALAVALEHPARVSRLHLIGVHPGLETTEAREARASSDAGWAERLRREGLEAFFQAWDQNPLFAGRERAHPERRAAQERLRSSHDAEQLARAMESLSLAKMPSFWARLPELPMETHLIVGELDEKFRGIADRMRPLIPRAELHVIPGVGHDVPFEAPDALTAHLGGQVP